MVKGFVGMSEGLKESLPGYEFWVMNPANTDNVLLEIKDGIVMYNVMDD